MATTNLSLAGTGDNASWQQIIASGADETMFAANCAIEFAYGGGEPAEGIMGNRLRAWEREVFPPDFGENLYVRPLDLNTRLSGTFVVILTPKV